MRGHRRRPAVAVVLPGATGRPLPSGAKCQNTGRAGRYEMICNHCSARGRGGSPCRKTRVHRGRRAQAADGPAAPRQGVRVRDGGAGPTQLRPAAPPRHLTEAAPVEGRFTGSGLLRRGELIGDCAGVGSARLAHDAGRGHRHLQGTGSAPCCVVVVLVRIRDRAERHPNVNGEEHP